jgi:hypothetical protein
MKIKLILFLIYLTLTSSYLRRTMGKIGKCAAIETKDVKHQLLLMPCVNKYKFASLINDFDQMDALQIMLFKGIQDIQSVEMEHLTILKPKFEEAAGVSLQVEESNDEKFIKAQRDNIIMILQIGVEPLNDEERDDLEPQLGLDLKNHTHIDDQVKLLETLMKYQTGLTVKIPQIINMETYRTRLVDLLLNIKFKSFEYSEQAAVIKPYLLKQLNEKGDRLFEFVLLWKGEGHKRKKMFVSDEMKNIIGIELTVTKIKAEDYIHAFNYSFVNQNYLHISYWCQGIGHCNMVQLSFHRYSLTLYLEAILEDAEGKMGVFLNLFKQATMPYLIKSSIGLLASENIYIRIRTCVNLLKEIASRLANEKLQIVVKYDPDTKASFEELLSNPEIKS